MRGAVWAESAEFLSLLEVVRDSRRGERPIRLVGFDPQVSSPRLGEYLAAVYLRA